MCARWQSSPPHRPRRRGLRNRAGASGDAHRYRNRSEGKQPQRHGLSQRPEQKPARGEVSISLVLLVGAGLFLRTLDNSSAPTSGTTRTISCSFERSQTRPSSTLHMNRLLSTGYGTAPGPAGRPSGNGVDAHAALGRHVQHRHVRAGPRSSHRPYELGRKSPSTASSSRRISSRQWEFRSRPAGVSPNTTMRRRQRSP